MSTQYQASACHVPLLAEAVYCLRCLLRAQYRWTNTFPASWAKSGDLFYCCPPNLCIWKWQIFSLIQLFFFDICNTPFEQFWHQLLSSSKSYIHPVNASCRTSPIDPLFPSYHLTVPCLLWIHPGIHHLCSQLSNSPINGTEPKNSSSHPLPQFSQFYPCFN